MRCCYSRLKMNKSNLELLQIINRVITEYRNQGYRLTLRQLYYQLVANDFIPNKKSEYSKLSRILTKGRMGGVVDWDAVEDRVRVPKIHYRADSPEDAMNDIINQYHIDRQDEQKTYIEVWCEKDALSGILYPITSKYGIYLMINRGYSSCTAMHEAFLRFKQQGNKDGLILYIGDHDPSGLDMIRDIESRLEIFCSQELQIDPPIVKQIALTSEQIEKYNPPPDPAKVSDPRAGWYIQKYGYESWEVDALKPDVLSEILESNIEKTIDLDLYNDKLQLEREDKEILKILSSRVEDVRNEL